MLQFGTKEACEEVRGDAITAHKGKTWQTWHLNTLPYVGKCIEDRRKSD